MSKSAIARSNRAADVIAPAGVPASILVVENYEDSASSLADLLEFCGYRVVVAACGKDALRLAEPVPDVVITELRLPDMDGHDLVRQLHERAGGKSQLVIAVTSRQREEDLARAAAAGVDLHFSKPADPRELLGAVARFFRNLAPGC
jgi:two-component system, OmpR family, response regulator